MQRVPGVSIARDAGEGRQITVRGLGPQFTRVRINGMEAMSANGGTDAAGGTNRGRSFDFNTFASELFNSSRCARPRRPKSKKARSAPRSTCAPARPFDYDGFTVVTSVQGCYNDISEDIDPRAAFLISNTFADGKFGALLSVAYTERKLLDEGSSTVRWQNSRNTDGTRAADVRVRSARSGYPATAPTLAQINAAFRPRIPRYDMYEHDQERLGVTGSLQWRRATPRSISLDALYAEVRRRAQRDLPRGAGVQRQRRGRHPERESARCGHRSTPTRWCTACSTTSTSAPKRASTSSTRSSRRSRSTAAHEFTEKVRLHGAGRLFRRPTTTTRSRRRCCSIAPTSTATATTTAATAACRSSPTATSTSTNPATWTLSQIRLRPQTPINTFQTASFELAWDVTDAFTLKAGPQYKKYEFETTSLQRSNGTHDEPGRRIIPARRGTPIAELQPLASISSNLDVPGGQRTTRWLIPDLDAAAQLFDLYDRTLFPLGIEPALGNNYAIEEEDTAASCRPTSRPNLGARRCAATSACVT